MKTSKLIPNLAALIGVAFTTTVHAQSRAFTYQGRLTENPDGSGADGIYNFRALNHQHRAASRRSAAKAEQSSTSK